MLIKRGQITLFVIIGVLIVGAILGAYILSNTDTRRTNIPENTKVAVLLDTTLDCMNIVYGEALTVIGAQGGYYFVDEGIFNGYNQIPYYYSQGRLLAPTIEDIEAELGNYVSSSVGRCVGYSDVVVDSEELGIYLEEKDLLSEDFYGYSISYSDVVVDVKIVDGTVVFTTNLDLTIIDVEDVSYIIAFEEFPESINSDLFAMHEIATYYATSLLNNDEGVCVTCLEEMVNEKGMQIETREYLVPGDELVAIFNNYSSIPFIFQFVNKYSEVDYDEDIQFLED